MARRRALLLVLRSGRFPARITARCGSDRESRKAANHTRPVSRFPVGSGTVGRILLPGCPPALARSLDLEPNRRATGHFRSLRSRPLSTRMEVDPDCRGSRLLLRPRSESHREHPREHGYARFGGRDVAGVPAVELQSFVYGKTWLPGTRPHVI